MKVDAALPYTPSLALTRAGDYLQLARPRLALLVLVTVGAGWLLAAGHEPDYRPLIHALIGTSLLFAGAGGLNQLLERDSDALMARTANRPLPAARLQPLEVLVVGCTLSTAGLAYLLAVGQPLAAGLGAFALISYVLVYTPLKRRTTLNTLVGAVAGAVPPLMGWAAARGRLDSEALALFLIVFLWQVPHFLAIAWIYRDEYRRAGLQVLPIVDPDGVQTGRQMIRYTAVLVLASLAPCALGLGSWISVVGAVVLGVVFLYGAIVFTRTPTTHQARQVFRTSLVFLPALLLVFILDARLLNGIWL
jgi:protoheme IX farnesyltransferase